MVTLVTCGQRRRHPQGTVESIVFYLASLQRLTTVQKCILFLLIDCTQRGPPFRPSLAALGTLCSCSRKTAWRALQGLDGQHGWIVRDWQGGQKTNVYLPGWRLKGILKRYRKKTGGKS